MAAGTIVRDGQLARLAAAAGFAVRSVQPFAGSYRDFEEADRIFGLTRNSIAATDAGYLSRGQAGEWLAALRQGPFLLAAVLFAVVAVVPPGPGPGPAADGRS